MTVSGPALRRLESHHAIHETALAEAEELTNGLRVAWEHRDMERISAFAELLFEHWETRILAHADAEEDGFYKEVVTENESLSAAVLELRRDHHVMRRLWRDARTAVTTGAVEDMVQRFEALILVDSIHSEDEESRLLARKP